MAKFLQMEAAYSIYKEEPDRVAEHFERFNKEFEQVCEAFKEVTGQVYKPGQEVKIPKPLAPVKPIPREPKPQQQQLQQQQQHQQQQQRQQTLSNQEQVDLEQFAGRHQLQELLQIFMKEGITLEDVLEMTEDNMKEVGIIKYGLRRRLLGAVREERGASGSASSPVPVERPEEEAPARVARADQSRLRPVPVSTFAEDMQTKCQLDEVRSSSSR